jgi:hypothetical protein
MLPKRLAGPSTLTQGRGNSLAGLLKPHRVRSIPKCSGSTTVGVWLANGGRFGLMLRDNGLDGRLMLNEIRYRPYTLQPKDGRMSVQKPV